MLTQCSTVCRISLPPHPPPVCVHSVCSPDTPPTAVLLSCTHLRQQCCSPDTPPTAVLLSCSSFVQKFGPDAAALTQGEIQGAIDRANQHTTEAIERESSLTLPHLTLPHLTLPHLTCNVAHLATKDSFQNYCPIRTLHLQCCMHS